jgi:hypothetical protein
VVLYCPLGEYFVLSATHLDGIPLVVGAIAGIALTPVLAPVALRLIGFSAAGPVAGEPFWSLPEPSLAHANNVRRWHASWDRQRRSR